MRSFSVRLSATSEPAAVVAALREKLNRARLTAQDALVLEQANACIEDFIEKAQLHRGQGTVIQIKKRFALNVLEFDIVLESPDKSGIFTRFTRALRGDI